jgi:dihydrofolate reductase
MNLTTTPKLALIVAASENNVIGRDNDLPWRLSADLKKFKSLTMGHSIIMGRKTFESIGRLLPGRETVIITRNENYAFEGAAVVHSVEQALEACAGQARVFLIGGAEIYRLAMPQVDEIYLTRVHAEVEGDTYLPKVDWAEFDLIESESFEANEKNDHRFSLQHYRRKSI